MKKYSYWIFYTTDISSGNNAEIDAAFVLNGETTMDEVADIDSKKPAYIFNNVRSFLNAIQE